MGPVILEFSDFRCFARSAPCRIEVRPGFTALVGPNNSGKSSFLRSFYELRELYQRLTIQGEVCELLRGNIRPASINGLNDPREVFFGDEAAELSLRLNFGDAAGERGLERASLVCDHQHHWRIEPTWTAPAPDRAREWTGEIDGTRHRNANGEFWDLAAFSECMRTFSNAMYVGPYRDVARQVNGAYYDLHIGSDFVAQWHNWKTGRDRHAQKAALRITEDVREVFGLKRLEIDANPGDVTIQVTTERGTRKLSEVGAGLAQFIVVFACAAMRRPSYILIDEPEVHLHPSLQARFVTSLASYATEGIIFATHSVGLARTIADRIYAFRLDGTTGKSVVRELAKMTNLAEFLGEMSFSTYQELGFDRLLLVEGASEVRTIQQWLRLYRGDHRIVVMNLGGSNMIRADVTHELNELKRITPAISVLIDSERAAADAPLSGERTAFVQECLELGFNVCVTARRATENYFTEAAIRRVKVSDKYTALQPYERLADRRQDGWSKTGDNWRIAAAMSKDDLAGTDLAAFFEKLLT